MGSSTFLKGRVLYQSSEIMIFSRGRRLFVSRDGCATYRIFSTLPVSFIKSLLFLSSLVCRLLRYGFHHVGPAGDGGYFAIFNKSAYFIDSFGKAENLGHRLKGGRPLCVAYVDGWCYYGEYASNKERRPVSINRFNREKHEQVAVVPGVRHIHGVFFDHYEKCIWFSTGDADEESGLWRLVNGQPRMIIGGGQQFRAVQLIFSEDYIYYGTDTPLEKNAICRIDRSGHNFERLKPVSSSVFYGGSTSDRISFATVVEPSEVNETKRVDVWVGTHTNRWSRVMFFKKDPLPMRFFQYGQVIYPFIDGECDSIWVYAMSVRGGNRSYQLSLNGNLTDIE